MTADIVGIGYLPQVGDLVRNGRVACSYTRSFGLGFVLGSTRVPEVERKFRLPAVPPEILAFSGVSVVQGYVLCDPGELRVRTEDGVAYMTVKGDGTMVRDEWEAAIPPWVFETLWTKTEGRRIEKTRYAVPYAGSLLEIDVYEGALRGLVTLECEFPSEDAARRFALPPWAAAAVDVTSDPSYKNKALASVGRPE